MCIKLYKNRATSILQHSITILNRERRDCYEVAHSVSLQLILVRFNQLNCTVFIIMKLGKFNATLMVHTTG